MLEIPQKWLGAVTVSESSSNYALSVLAYDSKTAAEGEVLFTVSIVYTVPKMEDYNADNNVALSSLSGDEYVFEINITQAGKDFGISEMQIRNLIKVY